MPFLFVDYDQGAGGEFFCSNLSNSAQCVPLKSESFDTGRTKVYDLFNNEFLTPRPTVVISPPTDDILYDIVPTHRYSKLAKELLKNVFSLRISSPDSRDELYDYYRYQQLHKVLFTRLPNKLLVGHLKLLARDSINPDFLKEINSSMNCIDLFLISRNIVPSDDSRLRYINHLIEESEKEPEFKFDLVVPYRDLFYDIQKVKESIADTFNITINTSWLETYQKKYEEYLSKT
jgi:hypothetical protein